MNIQRFCCSTFVVEESNILLSAFEVERETSALDVEFCRGEASSDLNRLFLSQRACSMLEEQVYYRLNMGFIFETTFIH